LINLMDRISNYAAHNEPHSNAIPEDIKAFSMLNEYCNKVIEDRNSMSLSDVLKLQIGLLTFSINCYPDKLEYIDHILGICTSIIENHLNKDKNANEENEENDDISSKSKQMDSESADCVLDLLLTPLDVISVKALSLQQYPMLMQHLAWKQRSQVASRLLKAVLETTLLVNSPEMTENLLTFLSPLVRDDPDTPSVEEGDTESTKAFKRQQYPIARLIHRMQAKKDEDYMKTQFKILSTARKHFGKGGVRRIKYTLPPLCFKYLELARDTTATGIAALDKINSAKEKKTTDSGVRYKKKTTETKKESEPSDSEKVESEKPTEEGDKEQQKSEGGDSDNAEEAGDATVEEVVEEDEDDDEEEEEEEEVETVDVEELENVVKACTSGTRKVFQYIHEIVTALAGVIEYQEMALKMFLQAALCADALEVSEESVSYEFFVQAFTLYEEVADTKTQLRLLPLMIGTVQKTCGFGQDNYETLCTKVTQYAARLLKKPDQCKMVYSCSHLFWDDVTDLPKKPQKIDSSSGSFTLAGLTGGGGDKTDVFGDGKRSLECLQKSLRIADACVASSSHVSLFIEILNRYIFFFDKGCEKVTAQYVSGLIALINEHLGQMDEDFDPNIKTNLEAFYKSTIEHVKAKAKLNPEKYADIDL